MSYLSIYTALVKRNHSVTMVLHMVERLRNWLPVGPPSAESNGGTRYLHQSSTHHTMNITERILEVYQDCVKAGLEVKLNLWSKGGNAYFSFSKTQSQSWKRRMRRKKALGTPYTEARSSETPVCEEGRKRAPYFDKTTTELPLRP